MHQAVDLARNPMPKMTDDDEKAYDLVQDAEYIYASFMHTYHIDLFEQQGKLHWKKFKALLNGLGEDTIFSRIVGIRTADLPTGKGTSKERERLRKLKRKYALKEDDTLEKMNEVRCHKCNRLLGKTNGDYEIKCPRCGTLNKSK